MKRYAYCMYNPLRYIDPSGWAMKPSNSRPDDPPGFGHYRPGIYNPTDSESAWLVRLPDVDVIATSLGSNANTNTTITPYTEGTPWNNYQQYSYLGTDTRPMPTLGSGGGGGGSIGMGPNNQWGNSKLTPGVVNNVVTGAGTITGYQKSLWEKPKSRTQKAINQKKAYETQKALKQNGITKSVKEIKASKITNLSKTSNVLGIVGLASTGVDVALNNGIAKPSHVMDLAIGVACLCPAGWIIGASYLAVDIGSYAITGQSIGSNVNNWCGGVGVDLKTFSIVY